MIKSKCAKHIQNGYVLLHGILFRELLVLLCVLIINTPVCIFVASGFKEWDFIMIDNKSYDCLSL